MCEFLTVSKNPDGADRLRPAMGASESELTTEGKRNTETRSILQESAEEAENGGFTTKHAKDTKGREPEPYATRASRLQTGAACGGHGGPPSNFSFQVSVFLFRFLSPHISQFLPSL